MTSTGPTLARARVIVSDRAAVADDAMRLTHDAYVDRGFLDPVPSGRRFAAPYLNPGTRFVVVYSADEPIATTAMVSDGPFGLPADRAFAEELDRVRAEADTVCEISGLAVAPMWRRRTRLLLGLVLGTVVHVNTRSDPGHRLVYVVEPRQATMMSAVLIGERSVGPRPLLGAPGTLMVTHDMSVVPAYFRDPSAPAARRLVAEYALDPDPDWLTDEPATGDWRRHAGDLIEESGLLARLRHQLALAREAVDARGARLVMSTTS